MKREIKFRGKRVDNGVWVYGSLVQYNGSQNWCDAVEIWKHDDSTEYGTYQEVDPDTVGQFTGLLDKDGVEIYEGDVCVYPSENYMQEPSVGNIYYDFGMFVYGNIQTPLHEVNGFFTVVGNIHDEEADA